MLSKKMCSVLVNSLTVKTIALTTVIVKLNFGFRSDWHVSVLQMECLRLLPPSHGSLKYTHLSKPCVCCLIMLISPAGEFYKLLEKK